MRITAKRANCQLAINEMIYPKTNCLLMSCTRTAAVAESATMQLKIKLPGFTQVNTDIFIYIYKSKAIELKLAIKQTLIKQRIIE